MFEPITFIVVAAFFVLVFLIGVIDRKRVTIDDYWVNSRATKPWVLVATTASSFVGVGSLISNAGVAYSGGGWATLALVGSFVLYFFIFARFFAPRIKEFGDSAKAYTLPDFLESRYDRRTRIAGTLVVLTVYGFFLALQILGIGIFVSTVGGLDPRLATLIGGLIVIAYTAIGGMRADIRTDIFQFAVMLVLLLLFLPLLLIKGGGMEALGSLPPSFLYGGEFAPWYVYVLGFFTIGATNLVSADLWQRAYAGDTARGVKRAMLVSSVIVLLFLVAGTLFGLIGKVVLPPVGENMVVPELLKLYLSPALFGLVLAGFFAAIMSSADTVLLVMSMTLVHDVYQKTLKKELSAERVLGVSRIVTAVLGILAVFLALSVFSVVHIVIDAVSFSVALIPAIIFGFYGRQGSPRAAFWSIIAGFIAVIIFLFIAPVQAFIPGIAVSFLAFFLVRFFERRKRMAVV
jgi:SSS family solute:Na+ symporter